VNRIRRPITAGLPVRDERFDLAGTAETFTTNLPLSILFVVPTSLSNRACSASVIDSNEILKRAVVGAFLVRRKQTARQLTMTPMIPQTLTALAATSASRIGARTARLIKLNVTLHLPMPPHILPAGNLHTAKPEPRYAFRVYYRPVALKKATGWNRWPSTLARTYGEVTGG